MNRADPRTASSIPPFPTFVLLTVLVTCFAVPSVRGSALDLEVRPGNRTVLIPGPGTGDLQIRIIAPDGEPVNDRPPLNLSLVIDKSGSMADEGKIDHVRMAAHRLVERMGGDDYLSLVTYDNDVRVLTRPRPVADRHYFHHLIDGIHPGGRTYLSGGLEEGYRQAKKARRRGYINRVLLLSDGLANVGVTDRRQLTRRAGGMYEDGISISTFGVGYQFDEDLMTRVARGGGGSYYYISDPGDILAALNREFTLAARTVATEVEIVIRLLGGCRFDSVIGHSFDREGDSVIIRLGDLSAGERRTLMAKLRVSAEQTGEIPVADVSLRYRDPASGGIRSNRTTPVLLEVVRDADEYSRGFDRDVVETRTVMESSVRAEEAAEKVDSGDREGALGILRKVADTLRKAAPSSPAARQELERNEAYQDQIMGMDGMDDRRINEVQKGVKYRSYQELHQK
ncbi:MAG: VWA domain-containing protein [bacterium]|nr:MAG: VWA domain-containing protein [bacterium]